MDESSSGEERAPFSSGTAFMLAPGEPVPSSPPASFGKGGQTFFESVGQARCHGHIVGIGRFSHIWYGYKQVEDGSNILAAESIKAASEGCHQLISQLDGHASGNSAGYFVRGHKFAPSCHQPLGGRDGVDRDGRCGGSGKLI